MITERSYGLLDVNKIVLRLLLINIKSTLYEYDIMFLMLFLWFVNDTLFVPRITGYCNSAQRILSNLKLTKNDLRRTMS